MPDPTSNNPAAAQDADSLLNPAPIDGPSADEPAELDAANASLAGALSVSFAVLRIVMILLVIVFLLSGFFTVAPDEVAVRTRFGKIMPGPEGDVLTPEGGPYFRWPAPIGQIYRVPTVTQRLQIDDSFVFRAARNSGMPLNEISQGERLQPEYDGALLTADKSIVHARYEVQYKVLPEDAARFVRHIGSVADLQGADDNRLLIFREANLLVTNAVEQAIVEDVAGTPLGSFLQGGRSARRSAGGEEPGDAGPEGTPDDGEEMEDDVETPAEGGTEPEEAEGMSSEQEADHDDPEDDGERHFLGDGHDHSGDLELMFAEEDQIRVRAQDVLTRLQCGITLISVTRTEQTVVSSVRPVMMAVQNESEAANQLVGQASSDRNTMLLSTAGPAWRAVLAVIEVYEDAYRQQETNPEYFQSAEQALRATFRGDGLGEVLTALADAVPEGSGQEAQLRSLARRYANGTLQGTAGGLVSTASSRASSYITRLEAEANNFEDQLAIYNDRPDFTRRRLFTDTLSRIFSNPDVRTTFLSPGSDLHLRLNPRDREQQLEEEQRARQERGAAGGRNQSGQGDN